MGCFYFTIWYVEEGKIERGKGRRRRRRREGGEIGITNKDKCLHITKLKIGLMT